MLNFRCGTILANLRQILVSFFHISEVIGKSTNYINRNIKTCLELNKVIPVHNLSETLH